MAEYRFTFKTTDIEAGAHVVLKYGHALHSGFYPLDLDSLGRPVKSGHWRVYGRTFANSINPAKNGIAALMGALLEPGAPFEDVRVSRYSDGIPVRRITCEDDSPAFARNAHYILLVNETADSFFALSATNPNVIEPLEYPKSAWKLAA